LLQNVDTMHCESFTQNVPHAVPVALQVNGAQPVVTPCTQVPVPVQTSVADATPFEQDAAPHAVPAGYNWHAPAPLQAPVVPHVLADCAAHSLSGSLPLAIGAQVPFNAPVFAWDAAKHREVQALLAQKPSTQKPV
jgi:hypothetical protein